MHPTNGGLQQAHCRQWHPCMQQPIMKAMPSHVRFQRNEKNSKLKVKPNHEHRTVSMTPIGMTKQISRARQGGSSMPAYPRSKTYRSVLPFALLFSSSASSESMGTSAPIWRTRESTSERNSKTISIQSENKIPTVEFKRIRSGAESQLCGIGGYGAEPVRMRPG
jgi:hypothetical protein